jgi:hypothetical protein
MNREAEVVRTVRQKTKAQALVAEEGGRQMKVAKPIVALGALFALTVLAVVHSVLRLIRSRSEQDQHLQALLHRPALDLSYRRHCRYRILHQQAGETKSPIEETPHLGQFRRTVMGVESVREPQTGQI